MLFLKNLLSLLLIVASSTGFAQKSKVKSPSVRVDPPFWWAGMAHPEVELLIQCQGIGMATDFSLSASDTKIKSITRFPNSSFIALLLESGPAQQPEVLTLIWKDEKGKPQSLNYSLLPRNTQPTGSGINPSDLIYLVFPDRFANGNAANDVVPGTPTEEFSRTGLKTRHGGDLKGIEDRLDYLNDLGVTALWLNPILENNQPKESYHGYAATDHYRVDPRLGTNEEFRLLVQRCHHMGIKMIWDVVYNHWGDRHYLQQNLPDSAWINWFPEFTRTNYRAETLADPYASARDRKVMTDGWFDKHMPDLNQRNVHVANYLIQQSIWWIEYAAIDAFRIDTYAYPDQQFMSELNQRLRKEYPDFVLFGETWVQGSPIQAWFTEKNRLNAKFSSELQGVTDFQLYYAILKGLNEAFGWEEGFRRIQMTLSHDFLYYDPYMNVTFLDNHDLSRYFSSVGEDFSKWKMGISLLLTLRGIPQIYYGTEILMKNEANPDALVREDFPGGWPGDPINKFSPEGRSGIENEAFNYLRTLANWRKNNRDWFGRSQLTQFVPEDNTYVYGRYDDGHVLLCAYNMNDTEASLPLNRFVECIGKKREATDIITGVPVMLGEKLNIPAKGVLIIELR